MHLQFSDAISSHPSSTRSVRVANAPSRAGKFARSQLGARDPLVLGALQLSRRLIARCSLVRPPSSFSARLGRLGRD